MYFSDLSFECEHQGENFTGNTVDNKQRINLSDHAYNVLLEDMEVFRVPHVKKSALDQPNWSGMVNRIFRGYRCTAHASVAQTLANEKNRLMGILGTMEPAAMEQAAELLVADMRKSLQKEIALRKKHHGHRGEIRIDGDSRKILASPEAQREKEYYDNRIGLYLDVLLEEYAELPFVERERIFYSKELEEFAMGISKGRVVQLILHSTRRVRDTTKNNAAYVVENNVLYIKPFAAQQDPEHLYNYLVGMISSKPDTDWQIGAVRLSSVKECRRGSGSGALTKDDENLLGSAIKKRGVQYLSETNGGERIVVQFTPEGEKLYHRMLHLRPKYVARSQNGRYAFDCTRQQAENYFFKFGHHVKILEPCDLAGMFYRKYSSAARQYSE